MSDDIQTMLESSTLLKQVREQFRRKEIPLLESPGYEVPKVPKDITGIPSEGLMELMSVFESLHSYANQMTAEADSLHTSRTEQYRTHRAMKYLTLRDDRAKGVKMTGDEIDAKLVTDPELERLKYEQILADSYKTMLKATADGFEGKRALLSRELTRRSNRGERE